MPRVLVNDKQKTAYNTTSAQGPQIKQEWEETLALSGSACTSDWLMDTLVSLTESPTH